MKSKSYPEVSAIYQIVKAGEQATKEFHQLDYFEKMLKVNPAMGNLLWKKYLKNQGEK